VPLAIEQAGAYLHLYRNISTETLKGFLEKLEAEYQKIMQITPKRSQWYYEKHRSVVETFNMLREALSRSNPNADKVLTLSAFLAPGTIPVTVLTAQGNIQEPKIMCGGVDKTSEAFAKEADILKWIAEMNEDYRSFDEALRALDDHCCLKIRWNFAGTRILSYSIHNAVRLWCQESWNAEKNKWTVLASYQLGRSLDLDNTASIVKRQRYLHHVRFAGQILDLENPIGHMKAPQGSLWPFAWLAAIEFGKFYQSQNFLDEAAYYLRKACEYEVTADNYPNTEESINTLHLLALIYWQSGKFDEAVDLYGVLFAACENFWGPNHNLTLKVADESCHVRMRALNNDQDWHRVVQAINQAKRPAALVEEDPTPLFTDRKEGSHEAADDTEYFLTEDVREASNLFGEHSADTITAKFKLAQFFMSQGRSAEAAPLAEVAWRSRMMAWSGRGDKVPCSSFLLDPFSVCLEGYVSEQHPISELVKEFPFVLHHAIQLQVTELIDVLLRGDLINSSLTAEIVSAVDELGHCPLLKAMLYPPQSNLDGLMTKLLSLGAEMEFRTTWGSSLLQVAVILGREDAVKTLVDYGAEINGKSVGENVSALHYAVTSGSIVLMDYLIRQGADVQSRTTDGVTPLHLAVLLDDREAVSLLLANGAISNAQTNLGAGPIHNLLLRSLFQVYIRDTEIYNTLLQDYLESSRAGKNIFGNAIIVLAGEQLVVINTLRSEWRLVGRPFPPASQADPSEATGDSILQMLMNSHAYIDLRALGLSTPMHLALALLSDCTMMANPKHVRKTLLEISEHDPNRSARDHMGKVVLEAIKQIFGDDQSLDLEDDNRPEDIEQESPLYNVENDGRGGSEIPVQVGDSSRRVLPQEAPEISPDPNDERISPTEMILPNGEATAQEIRGHEELEGHLEANSPSKMEDLPKETHKSVTERRSSFDSTNDVSD
jgi:tetratricopeptide (TPR) repeat protein